MLKTMRSALAAALSVLVVAQPMLATAQSNTPYLRYDVFKDYGPIKIAPIGKPDPGTGGGTGGTTTARVSVASTTVRVGDLVTIPAIAVGLTAPITWSFSGSLPAGLAFDSALGSIRGTATAPGTFSGLTITGMSGTTSATSNPFSITVNPTLSITQPPALQARVGVPFSTTFSASGASGAVTWSISTPVGLSTSGASLSGTPNQAGSFTVSVQAQDASGARASATTSLTVTGPSVSVPAGASGTVGTAITFNATASGLTGTPTWSLNGAPAGMMIADGVVSWTPNASGTFPGIAVKVTDADGSYAVSQPITVSVSGIGTPTAPVYPATSKVGWREYVWIPVTTPSTGGTGNLTYSIASLTPDSTAFRMEGSTLRVAGWAELEDFTLTIVATDENGVSSPPSAPMTVRVIKDTWVSYDAGPRFTIGQQNAYLKIQGWGGTGIYTSYTLSVNGVNVPDGGQVGNTGLIFNAAAGTISGTVADGATSLTSGITATVTDSRGTQSAPATSDPILIYPKLTAPVYSGGFVETGNTTYVNPTTGSGGGWGGRDASLISVTPSTSGFSMDRESVVVDASVPTGEYDVVVQVADWNGATAQASVHVSVGHFITIGFSSLPQAIPATVYDFAPYASGGVPPYNWALSQNGVQVFNTAYVGDTNVRWMNGVLHSNSVDGTTQSGLVFTVWDSRGTVVNSAPMTLTLDLYGWRVKVWTDAGTTQWTTPFRGEYQFTVVGGGGGGGAAFWGGGQGGASGKAAGSSQTFEAGTVLSIGVGAGGAPGLRSQRAGWGETSFVQSVDLGWSVAAVGGRGGMSGAADWPIVYDATDNCVGGTCGGGASTGGVLPGRGQHGDEYFKFFVDIPHGKGGDPVWPYGGENDGGGGGGGGFGTAVQLPRNFFTTSEGAVGYGAGGSGNGGDQGGYAWSQGQSGVVYLKYRQLPPN